MSTRVPPDRPASRAHAATPPQAASRPATASATSPAAAVHVDVSDDALRQIAAERSVHPLATGGSRPLDVRLAFADGKLDVRAGNEPVAMLTFPEAAAADLERLANAFAALPESEVAALGAQLQKDIRAVLVADANADTLAAGPDAVAAADATIARRLALAATLSILAVTAVAFFAGSVALHGELAQGLAAGADSWLWIPLLCVAGVLAGKVGAHVEDKTVQARAGNDLGALARSAFGERQADAARATLVESLRAIGVRLDAPRGDT